MCGRSSDSTTLPQCPAETPADTPADLSGPFDDRFGYRVTEEGMKALAEYERAHGKPAFTKEPLPASVAEPLATEARRVRKRRRRKIARSRGRRLLTVCGRWQGGREVPDLRMTGRWLERAGFDLGQEYEVQVEAGRLTLRIL
ncbi:MAG TPA: SymE family type I addiction module toxin [Thermoanaerobaculia bacterium]|nr:SymE family type I addiction module toxin [Thermoanaerobaculia bacterium]